MHGGHLGTSSSTSSPAGQHRIAAGKSSAPTGLVKNFTVHWKAVHLVTTLEVMATEVLSTNL
jgi:hypothetical protein